MTSTSSAIRIAENLRINDKSDYWTYLIIRFSNQYLLRDAVIEYLIDNIYEIYDSHGNDITWIITPLCQYIQNDQDMSLINALKDSLMGPICNDNPDCNLPDQLVTDFRRCTAVKSINEEWQNTVG